MTAWISMILLITAAIADDPARDLAEQRVKEARTVLKTDPPAAIVMAKEAADLAQELGDESILAQARLLLANAYFKTGQTELALEEAILGKESARTSEVLATLVSCQVIMGSVYARQSRYEESIRVFEEALETCEENGYTRQKANILHNLSIVYEQKGDLAKALELDLQTLKMRGEDEGRALANTLNNIGSIYSKLGEHEKALDYMQRSLKLKEQDGDPRMIAIALNNLGILHADLGQKQQAREYLERALEAKRQLDNPISLAATLNNLGSVYLDLEDYDQALDYLQQAVRIRSQKGLRDQEIETQLLLSRLSYRQADLTSGLAHAERALDLAKAIETPNHETVALSQISMIREAMGQPQAALDAFRRATQIQDSLMDESTRLQIGDLQGQIEALEKTREMELLQRDHQIQQLELKDKLWLRNASIAGLVGLGLLATIGFLLRNRSAQARINQRLEAMVEERTADLKQRTRELNRMHHRLLEAAHHAGRAEVAIDVVHHIGNSLNSVNTSASVIFERLRDRRLIEFLADLAGRLAERRQDEKIEIQGINEAVATLLDKLRLQNEFLTEEAQALTESIQALNTAVKAQHLHANVSWLYETVHMGDFLNQFQIHHRDTCLHHGVTIAIDCRIDKPCCIQRIRLHRAVMDLMAFAISKIEAVEPQKRKIDLAANIIRNQIILEFVMPHAEQTHPDLKALKTTEEIVREMGGTWSVENQIDRLSFQITLDPNPDQAVA